MLHRVEADARNGQRAHSSPERWVPAFAGTTNLSGDKGRRTSPDRNPTRYNRRVPARVFTIPPTLPFADTLAAGLLARAGGEPEALARVIVLLPTRRACRALREAFLRQSAGKPLLLPRLSPIGDVDEEELVLTAGEYEAGTGFAEIPPAISSLRRRLLLAELIRKFEQVRQRAVARDEPAVAPDQAVWLAADLARLLDEAQTERRDLGALETLVPDEFAAHWQHTLEFLKILTEQWPKILAAEGALDPAQHRNRLLEAQAAAWRARPPAGPVIAAGSTGSIPATADLLATVAGLPQGSVVLPGLDTALDDVAWSAVAEAPSHPQHGLARLLDHLGLARKDVLPWDGSGAEPAKFAAARLQTLSAALRPAEAPPRQPGAGLSAETVSRAFAGPVSYLECINPREEAAAIAVALREALDTPGSTAALVTPNRDLARRVAAAMQRWGIEIDDSAGVPLASTPPMAFLRLVLDAAAENFAPVPLLAMLKHPLAAGGRAPGVFRAQVRALERAALRGPRPPPGLDGLRLRAPSYAAFVNGLEYRLAPLTAALAETQLPVETLLRAHVEAAEALAADDAAKAAGAARLWAGEAGEAAARFLDELAPALRDCAPIRPGEYAELLEALLAGAVMRPRYGTHPRLAILGPLEARLQRFDLMVLGSLNEGTWPAAIAADPWMSRPMRTAFGLPLAERRIGLSAHDFAQAAMAPRVLLTRALRQSGQPTRPSRWLLRIEAELEGLGLFAQGSPYKLTSWRSHRYQAWARALDKRGAGAPGPVERPAPCPPVSARPRRISVTQVELWRRDPYAVYARHVLRLRPLDPLDADPSAADLGNVLHKALAAFVSRLGDQPLPTDAIHLLVQDANAALTPLRDRPGVWAFWLPRIARIARWFVGAETARRAAGTLPLATEIAGTFDLAAPAGPFVLSGTADRIDRQADGTLAIIDYKTGTLPKNDEIELGFAPQLALEALIAEHGGFGGVIGKVTALEYWRLAGRDGGEIKPVKANALDLIAAARSGFAALVDAYDRPTKRYPAAPRPARAARFNDYLQLARTQEWIGR